LEALALLSSNLPTNPETAHISHHVTANNSPEPPKRLYFRGRRAHPPRGLVLSENWGGEAKQLKAHCSQIYIFVEMAKPILVLSVVVFLVGLGYLLSQVPPSAFSKLGAQSEGSVLRDLNNKTSDILYKLVQTKYFRLLRRNLNSKCPLPYMHKLCKSKSCEVCRCDEKDIPQNWVTTDKVKSTQGASTWADERDDDAGKWVWHVEDK
jgi:hypothetical protein